MTINLLAQHSYVPVNGNTDWRTAGARRAHILPQEQDHV